MYIKVQAVRDKNSTSPVKQNNSSIRHETRERIRQSRWISAITQKINRSWQTGTTSNGTLVLRRSQKERTKTYRRWLTRSTPFRRLNTTATDIATLVRTWKRTFSLQSLLTEPGTHARTQGIVKGTLVTEKNLPKHLKQSMFAEEKEWPVLCRYSSEPGDPGLDVSFDASFFSLDSTDAV